MQIDLIITIPICSYSPTKERQAKQKKRENIQPIRDRRLLAFLVLVFLAGLIHRSAFAFLPAYWIYQFHFSNRRAVLAIVCGILIGSIIDFSDYFSSIGSFLGGMYEAKIEGYMSRGADMSFNAGQTAAQLYMRSMLGRLPISHVAIKRILLILIYNIVPKGK